MIKTNAIAGALSSVIIALTQFLIYRVAYQSTGAQILGAWSLLSAFMTLARVGEAGVGLGLLRLVVIDRRVAEVNVWRYIGAGLLIANMPTILTAGLGGAVGFWYLRAGIGRGIGLQDLWTLVISSWLFAILNSISSVISGCLDGYGKMFSRIICNTIAYIALCVLSWIFIPKFKTLGIGIAYVGWGLIYCGGLLGIALTLPKPTGHASPSVLTLARRARKVVVGGLAIGACRAAFDPLCKFLVGQFGGLAAVAIFDLANRMSIQVRTVIASYVQAISPVVSRTEKEQTNSSEISLSDWWSFTYLLSGLAALALIAAAPILSEFAFRGFFPDLIIYIAILAVGGWINGTGLIGFYSEMGQGQLSNLIRVHLVMIAINVVIGVSLGFIIGPTGVVLGWSAALIYNGWALFRRSDWRRPHAAGSGLERSHLAMIASPKALGILALAVLLSCAFLLLAHQRFWLMLVAGTAVASVGLATTYELLLDYRRLKTNSNAAHPEPSLGV